MGEEYKISLGVDISVDDIQSQINIAENKVKPIKLNVEIENLDEIKKQIQNLGRGDKTSLTLNTDSLEESLRDVKSIIVDIKNSLGTLDSKSGMKSLLSSVNQIVNALGKAEDESKSLVNSLNALANKDFSINLGIKMGGSNSVSNNAAYGDIVRNQVIPELQKQERALANYLSKHFGTNEISAINTLLTKSGNDIGGFKGVWETLDKFNQPIKKGELGTRMQELRDYINLVKKAAAELNIDLSPVLSGFDKQADEMVSWANDVRDGTTKAKESVSELEDVLKRAFGGANIDSEQFDAIVKDLGEIKIAIQDLSKGINIDEITQSFKEMSVVLKDITDNLVVFRNAFGNVGSGLGDSLNGAVQELKNGENVLDTFKRSLKNIGMSDEEIDSVANSIKNLGVQIETLNQKKRTIHGAGDDNGNQISPDKEILSVDISGIDKFGNAVKLTQEYDLATNKLIKSVDKVSTVHQKAGKSADTFAKQQKRAVTDLTNQIDQLNRSAIDQNAPRPIKETVHLDSLKSKYNEIISAIERMGTASNATFEDERNKVKTLIAEYKSLKSEYKNAENVALEMDGNDFASGLEIAKNKLAEFKAQAQGFSQLTQTIRDLDKAIEGVGDVSSLKEFNNQLRVAKSELSKVKTETSSVGKIKFKLKDTGFNGFEQEVARANAAVNKLKNSTPALQVALQRLNAAMEAVNAADEANDVQKLVSANKEYEAALKQVNSQLKLNQQIEDNLKKDASFEAAKEGALLRLKGLFGENSQAAKKFSAELDRIQKELNECGDTKGLTKINREITNLGRQIKESGAQTQTFGQRFKKQWQQYTSYFSVASVFSWGTQALRSMFEQVKLIDSAMTELKKVTNETDEAYNKFLTNAATRSREIGTTIDGLVKSTADFARLGYGFEDAQGLAEVANIYAVVGDEIEGVEGATESLISTMAAFKKDFSGLSESDFALSVVDKMNEVSNNFAISSGGLGEALKRSASAMYSSNNTLDETIALITASNTVVQDADVVGNAYKTIALRIRGAKSELEEMGEDTSGMAESSAKLRDELLALSGVDILEADGKTFKSTYDILNEISMVYKDLSDLSQANILEKLAGKRQSNILSAALENFDIAREALETSMNSSGSATAELEKWQKSLEAQINKLKSSWQGLSQAFLKSDFLKVVLNGIIKLADGLTTLIDKFGTLPTLLGVVAAGFSAFKSQGLFKFDKDVQSIKLLGTQLNGLKGKFTQIHTAIDRYNSLSSKSASFQEKYNKTLANSNTSMGKYLRGLNGSKASFSGYIGSLVGATVKTIALEAATIALNAALTMGISFAVQAIITAFDKWIVTNKELAESVEEVITKFKEEHNELQKLKGDYDTSNESSMISKYEKLSKGVDNLGRNVSLTADEYSEYQSIVNQIAEQIPSLVSGYDSQGNAILSCKDNVKLLVDEYQKLIHAQNTAVLGENAKDIEKNYKKTVKKASGEGVWSNNHGFWAGILKGFDAVGLFSENYDLRNDTVKSIETLLNSTNQDEKNKAKSHLINDDFSKEELRTALERANVDIGYFDDPIKVLEKTLETNPEKIKNIIDNYYSQFAEIVEQQKTIAKAKLSEAFDISSAISGLNYSNISEDLQAVAYQVVNSLDKDFFDKLQSEGKTVEQWTTEMLDQLNSIGKDNNAKIEAAFDLQTKFNGGEISYGEYVEGLEDTGKLIERLNLKPELESQLKLSLGLDEKGFVEGYKKLRNRLASDEYFDIMPSDYVPFIESLSSEELSVLWQVIPELEATDYKESIADVKAALEKEMMLQGLTFDLNLEVETAGIEALNTALAESVSATGLSSESITALKGRYADLEAQGYDLSVLFEETSHGIHLNRREFNKLEKAYATDKLAKVDGELGEMKEAYDDLGEAIKNTDDPVKKAELYNDRQTLAKKISEAATLASQYEALTSAYNDWLAAEESGQERDMYENVIEGFENIGDEISRGWYDDGTIEFLEMLTGRTDLAGKSAKELKEIYNGLDKSIKYIDKHGRVLEDTGYSVRDFFTVDDEGNATADGVYNFLDAIGKLEEEAFGGKDIVKRDKNGKPISFDFELAGGDEAIADALGVSKELVQIMKRAADDAGFVVSMDGTYKQLADLENEARASANKLKEIGKTDFDFNFNTSSATDLKNQLVEANKVLDKFKDKDGNIDLNADGATDAIQVVSTLQAKLDKVTEEKYGIGLTVEDEEFEEPLENLQEYGRNVQALNQLKINPKANAEEIKELNGELNNIAEYFANLDKDTKIKLGFEANDGIEEVKKKIENGEIKIPTVLDIQANMDKNIETLTDLALLNSGLLSEKEEETIRKKYNVEVEGGDIDTSDVDDKVDSALEGANGNKKTRTQNIEVIAETFGVEDVDDLKEKLKGLNSKTIQAIAESVGQIDVDKLQNTVAKLKPKKVKAIAEAIGKGDIDGLKKAINKLKPKHVQAIAEALGYDDVDALNAAIEDLDPKTVQAIAEALGITDVDSLKSAIDNLQPKDVTVTANTSGESKVSGLKSLIDGIKDKFVTVTTFFKKITSGGSTRNDSNGYNEVNGTANMDGTAFANGTSNRAFKRGNWGTKSSGTALMGELGRKIFCDHT